MRLAVRTLLVTMLCLMLAAPAGAKPEYTATETSAAGDTPPIGLRQLGLSDKLTLLGSDQAVDVAVPVPHGVTPKVLTGQIGAVVNAVDARIDVFDGLGVHLDTIVAPKDLTTQPFLVDISAANVNDDGTAPLSFILRQSNPPADSCTQLSSATLSGLATVFSGPPPNPHTVSDFLPAYLNEILIRIGSNPSSEQQQAALTLVANLTRLYRPMPVRIDVDTSAAELPPPPAPAGPRRVIVIASGPKAGLTVANPGTDVATLVISGSSGDLTRQVELFTDRRYALAQTPSVAVTAATENAPKTGTLKTFQELGMTGEISVLGTATQYIGFDAGQFGVGSIESAKIHLRANYTPLIGGEGSVLVRAGSTVVATHVLDQSGVLDIQGDIPANSIRSKVGIGIEVRYTPRRDCAPLNDRITFAIDPGSTVSVKSGFHNRGGFGVLPMAFTPDFDVAIDKPERIRYAAMAINLMSQQTGVALRPRLTSLDEAAGSGSGALIVAPGDELAKRNLHPPLLVNGDNTVVVNGNPTTDVDLNGPTGVVQAFTDSKRTVLALTAAGDWGLIDRSLDYVRGLEGHWSSVTGDVIATGAAGQTVNLTIREGGALIDEYPGDGWKWWAWLSGGFAVLTVLGVAAFLVIRVRRRPATE